MAFTEADGLWLSRTLHLAQLGTSAVSPNPRVGALLVSGERILSEGWHQLYGGPHAEVLCLGPVTDAQLLAQATLYVSLEPCSHHGKTPPCTDLILAKGIRRVVVGTPDPNPQVGGAGIERLRAAGVEVLTAPDPAPFVQILRPFFVNQRRHRPYVILKWAQTPDGKLGRSMGPRLYITGPRAMHYTHALRAQVDALAVGWRTVAADNPHLTLRHAPGRSPRVLVFDPDNRLPDFRGQLELLDHPERVLHLTGSEPLEHELAQLYHTHRIGSLLVEGGADTLRRFIEAYLWDEAHVFVGPTPAPDADVRAPALPPVPPAMWQSLQLGPDRLLRTFAPVS